MSETSASASNARNPGLFNPERPQALVARYQNFLSKGRIDAIRVIYTTGGVEVRALPHGLDAAEAANWVTLDVATRREVAAATDQSNLAYWRNRYEARLDRECPQGWGNSGAQEAIDAAIQAMPFRERRALLMSNKDFDRTYPNGWRDGLPVPGN